MRNIEFDINDKYHRFVERNHEAPNYLYLGHISFKALTLIVNSSMVSNPEKALDEYPYMGMKILLVANDENHVNVA